MTPFEFFVLMKLGILGPFLSAIFVAFCLLFIGYLIWECLKLAGQCCAALAGAGVEVWNNLPAWVFISPLILFAILMFWNILFR